jgi:lysophospholipase L1-like esterase
MQAKRAKSSIRKIGLRGALLTLIMSATLGSALACPKITGLSDFNCDQTIRITFTGDSIVRGTGDIIAHGEGGYVYRLRALLPQAKILNLGIPSVTTTRLLDYYAKGLTNYNPRSQIAKRTQSADLIIIDAGRNDYWLQQSPDRSVRNIQRLVELLETKLNNNGRKTFIMVSTLISTNRYYQQPFVNAFNELIKRKSRAGRLPPYLDFAAAKLQISPDGVHPTSAGYKKAARFVSRKLTSNIADIMQSSRRDQDADGIFDVFENGTRYPTSSQLWDTDGDGYSDGEEIFELGSDPLDPLDPPMATPSPTPTPEASSTPTATPTPAP